MHMSIATYLEIFLAIAGLTHQVWYCDRNMTFFVLDIKEEMSIWDVSNMN